VEGCNITAMSCAQKRQQERGAQRLAMKSLTLRDEDLMREGHGDTAVSAIASGWLSWLAVPTAQPGVRLRQRVATSIRCPHRPDPGARSTCSSQPDRFGSGPRSTTDRMSACPFRIEYRHDHAGGALWRHGRRRRRSTSRHRHRWRDDMRAAQGQLSSTFVTASPRAEDPALFAALFPRRLQSRGRIRTRRLQCFTPFSEPLGKS